ncbi:hypothetical protein TYRP_023202 [Tyrophagus putrescentiae]|nr:hypothetical protein TYRP_023202 [Tyrophagus putrescentiae]
MKHAIALVSTDIVKNFVKPDKFSTSSTSSVLSSIITSKSVIQLAENNFLSCQSGLGRLWACTTDDSKVFRFFTNLSEPIVLKKLLNHLYNKHHNEQQTVQCTANDDNCFAKSMNFLYSQFTHHSMIYHQVNVYKCVHQKCFEGTLVFGTLIEVANHYNSAHADVKDWEKLCTSLIGNVSEPANMFVEKTVPANDDVLMNDDETGDRAANSMLENEEHETMDQDNCSATVCQTSNENKKKFRKTKKGVVLRNAPVSPPGFTLPTVVTSPKQNCAKSNPIFLQSTSKGKPLSTTIEHSAEHLNSKKEEEKRRKRKAVQSSVLPIAKLPNLGSKTTVEEVSLPGKLSINSATSVLTVQPQLPPDTLLNEFSQRNYALWKTPLSKAFRFFTPSHALSATSANCSQNMPKMLIYVNLSFCRVGLFKDKDAVGLDTCYDGGNGDCVHDHIRPVLVQGLSGLSVEEVKESREPLPQHVFQQKLLVQWRRLRSIFQNSASGSDRRLKKEFQEQEADLTDDHRRLLCPFADQCKQLSFVSRFELQRHFFERHYLIRNGFTCTTADSCASSGALYSYADWSHHQAIYHLKGRYYCAKLGCGHSNLRPIETIAGVLRHYDLAHSGTNLWERFVSQIRLLDFSYSCAEGATEQNHDRQKCPQCKEERQKEAKWIQRQSSRFEESTTWFSKTEDD